jgi:hypothetical protein
MREVEALAMLLPLGYAGLAKSGVQNLVCF